MTRIPLLASSLAAPITKVLTAPFVAAYIVLPGLTRPKPETELVNTTEEFARSFFFFTRPLRIIIGAMVFTLSKSLKTLNLMNGTGTVIVVPALFTNPCISGTSSIRRLTSFSLLRSHSIT